MQPTGLHIKVEYSTTVKPVSITMFYWLVLPINTGKLKTLGVQVGDKTDLSDSLLEIHVEFALTNPHGHFDSISMNLNLIYCKLYTF